MTTNNIDFGFDREEFRGETKIIPYCQFINSNTKDFGIAITSTNAELAQFNLIANWHPIEHQFADGVEETLLITKTPRMLVINRSQPLMSNETETIPYDRAKASSDEGYKAFSYAVVWFLDDNNQPISELPFRLKCSGYSGVTFLQGYSYFNRTDSFCKKFLNVYRTLTGDRASDKNDTFYAHAVYCPSFVREKATSSYNGQSSFAVQTESFIEPNQENFASLIIKNGSPTSDKIKELIDSTRSWLKTEVATVNDELQPSLTEEEEEKRKYEEFEPAF